MTAPRFIEKPTLALFQWKVTLYDNDHSDPTSKCSKVRASLRRHHKTSNLNSHQVKVRPCKSEQGSNVGRVHPPGYRAPVDPRLGQTAKTPARGSIQYTTKCTTKAIITPAPIGGRNEL